MNSFVPLNQETLAHLRSQLLDDLAATRARNAVTSVGIDDAALNREAVVKLDHTVEHKLDSLAVTDQKRSGRCWLFAALNVHRHAIAKKLNLENFNFSYSYVQYFDKLERSRFFLTEIRARRDQDIDHRVIAQLLRFAAEDGGWYGYVGNLVHKYGVVPDYAMPEVESAGNTRELNRALSHVLRRGACRIRDAESDTEADAIVDATLRDAQRVITVHLGAPPTEFMWQYRTKDDTFVREGMFTPREFAEKYLPDFNNTVVLAEDPRSDKPKNTRFLVELCTNVVGAQEHNYVNMDMSVLKDAVAASIEAGEPVWFACDVNRQFNRKLGVWDPSILDLAGVYGVALDSTKEERFISGESQPTHAMVLSGFNRNSDGSIRAWRVENSWGSQLNDQKTELVGAGYATMSDEWFEDNVFYVAIKRDFVPEKLHKVLDTEPVRLPAYDLMF
ncbi:C1 family peptidase [Corynebacterium pseudotuberculosis]|uniref:C1 family peptidase n=1 Tax=Corynebacterium pseudotuberculosis TaxID=1719 RepID=UPI00064C82F3|nr:C1 family peptidase [Corynebacterium pseudotuberculosis]APA72059.1 Aminopeptidase G [Corynebacterium pseudotuberculosis]